MFFNAFLSQRIIYIHIIHSIILQHRFIIWFLISRLSLLFLQPAVGIIKDLKILLLTKSCIIIICIYMYRKNCILKTYCVSEVIILYLCAKYQKVIWCSGKYKNKSSSLVFIWAIPCGAFRILYCLLCVCVCLCVFINRLPMVLLSKLNIQESRHFCCWIRLENVVL